VKVAIDVSTVYISHNVLNGSECSFHVRSVVHCQKYTGNNLKREEQTYKGSVASVIVKVSRSGIVEHVICQQVLQGFVSVNYTTREGLRKRVT
jgi:hypothetical protein